MVALKRGQWAAVDSYWLKMKKEAEAVSILIGCHLPSSPPQFSVARKDCELMDALVSFKHVSPQRASSKNILDSTYLSICLFLF